MARTPVRSTILEKTDRVIDLDEALAIGHKIIDVRSAAEFLTGTIPGAINIPLFDEDERGVIGTIYRRGGQGGHTKAVDQGFDFVEKKLAVLVASFQSFQGQPLAICCARGGMRSLSVVNLLTQAGFTACQLKGGYKKYRRNVLGRLEIFRPRLIVIHGLTGTGKTRILQRLQPAIDLEDLAGHRSSLFGGLDRLPSNQRTFESRLAEKITTLGEEPYFIEGESRKIGRVFIPKPLAQAMKHAVLVNIHCSLETRIARIIEDYPVADEEMQQQIESILRSLKQKMGVEQVEKMCGLLQEGKLPELVRILLLEYYDKRYGKSMSEYRFALDISAEDIDAAAARLEEFRRSLPPVEP
ncbi:MAG: tRNA 2-selenouridine(34) synthase MnmH [Proteobacteria bacterium]|nr:tRNA 2-selenouridine(34) synthase MnmH [Pseudomonadota bacterium]